MSGIFVSYRRKGAATSTFRLVSELQRAFGDEKVFFDVESINPGVSFADEIRNAIAKSSVILVVIGPRWLMLEDKDGHRRLDNPDDWIRKELEIALDSKKPVIQVLVEGAEPPDARDLPETIRLLAGLQAFPLVDDKIHWDFDVRRLVEKLRRISPGLDEQEPKLASKPSEPPPPKPRERAMRQKVIAVLGVLGFLLVVALMTDEGNDELTYSASSYCSVTGATGVAFGAPTQEQANAAAIENCIDNGGIPLCCQGGLSW